MPSTSRGPKVLPVLAAAALTATALLVPPAAATPAPATSRAAAAPTAHAITSSAQVRANAVVKQRERALKLLDRVNSVRRQGRVCGSTRYPAAKPLTYRTSLATAARRHARDMARNDYFSHTGRNGSGPSDRARAAGYHGGTGENIAAGDAFRSVARTMSAWLSSPGHCANIMSRSYRHLGIGFAHEGSSTYQNYWVQDFGTG